jgi:hypothetical protein
VSGVNAPPVIRENVEDGKNDDEESSSPFCFESDCDQNTSSQANDRHEDTSKAPLTLKDETDEEEDQQNTTRELEARLLISIHS